VQRLFVPFIRPFIKAPAQLDPARLRPGLPVLRAERRVHSLSLPSFNIRVMPRPRINSVLTYGEHPGMKLNELTQKLFYGRTA